MRDFDEVYKHEWPKVVATLMRDLKDLDLASDVTQDAFLKAAKHWSSGEWPASPGAWLVTAARRIAIDRIRRTQNFDQRIPELRRQLEVSALSAGASDHGLVDDRLALILGCCHPALAPEGQVALTLRIVAGLSTRQIAEAFLVSESTMTRRISRAKQKIAGANIVFSADRRHLLTRLGSVCSVIYSIYNEGHRNITGPEGTRGDLCQEALWLAGLLEELVPQEPEVSGLHALLLLSDARQPGRVTNYGSLAILAEQDRSSWDTTKIDRGLRCLASAHSRGRLGPFQIQAAISALHSTAPSFEDTDWLRIISLYDLLLVDNDDAVISLNRAAAIGHLKGAKAGLKAIADLSDRDRNRLASYPYFHACRGEFFLAVGNRSEARTALEQAAALSVNETERTHVESRLNSIGD